MNCTDCRHSTISADGERLHCALHDITRLSPDEWARHCCHSYSRFLQLRQYGVANQFGDVFVTLAPSLEEARERAEKAIGGRS